MVLKKMIKLNFQGLTKILHSKSKFKAIILLSTMSVYGKINSNIVSEKTGKKYHMIITKMAINK